MGGLCIENYRAAIGHFHLKRLSKFFRSRKKLSPYSKTKLQIYKMFTYIVVFQALLLMSGDVQVNPGPNNLSVCHVNIRSLNEEKIDFIKQELGHFNIIR